MSEPSLKTIRAKAAQGARQARRLRLIEQAVRTAVPQCERTKTARCLEFALKQAEPARCIPQTVAAQMILIQHQFRRLSANS